MNIKSEISEFWNWAKTSPNEYSQNRAFGECETEYPNWNKLNDALDQAIRELNNIYEIETAELLIQGLAIDNESELTLEKIEENLKNKNRFIEQTINSNQPQAKMADSRIVREWSNSKCKSIFNKTNRGY